MRKVELKNSNESMKDTLQEINRSHPGRKIIDSKKCWPVWGEGRRKGETEREVVVELFFC